MTAAKHTANTSLISSVALLQGRLYEVTTYKGGRVEVYRESSEDPGLHLFLGYYDELCTNPRIAEVVHPLVLAHEEQKSQFWSTYLPGAEGWIGGVQ